MILLFNLSYYIYVAVAANHDENVQIIEQSLEKQESNLETTKSKLKKKEKIFEETKKQAQNLSKELNKTNKEISKAEKTLKNLKKDMKNITNEEKIIQDDLLVFNQNLCNHKKNLKSELTIIYKEKLTEKFSKILIEDRTSGYWTRKIKVLKLLVWKDYKSLIESQKEINNLSTLKETLTDKRKDLKSLESSVSRKQHEYLKAKKDKINLLKDTEGKQIEQEKEISELKESVQEMGTLITELRYKLSEIEKKKLKKLSLVKQKGNLIWPVHGEVISLFGKYKHSDLNTYLFNNGIKINSEKGSEVLAVAEGVILFANDFKGYGKTVIIEHNQNFCTVYSRLGKIKVNPGQYVNKSDIIGSIDSSLYFEIRLDNKPEDPLIWLTSQ